MPYAGRHPFGDIYSVNNSAVDNIAKRLVMQQQLKEQQQRQDNQALDNEFSRNMSGMRDADIGDLTKAYGEFKNAHIGLQRKGNKVTPEDQIDLLRKKAAVNEIISKSKAQREQEKQYGSSIMKDGNKYVRDAHGKLIQIMNTPVSKLGDADPFADLPYKGNMTNLQKIFTNAAGKEIKMDDEVVDNVEKLRKDVTHVSRMANAVEYYKNILGQVVGSQTEDDLVRSVATNISPEIYQATKMQYEQMMADPIMRKRLGMTNSDLPPDEGLTEPERAAKFLAMTHQLAAKPVLKEGQPIYDRTAIIDKQNEDRNKEWDRRNKITYKQSLNKIAANKAAGLVPEDLGYVSDNVSDEVGEDVPVRDKETGRVTNKRFVDVTKVDPERLNIIIGRDPSKKMIGVKPTELVIKGPDGNPKTLIGYYVDPNTGDWEGAVGQKASREAAKDRYVKSMAGTKFKAQSGTKASENTKKIVIKKGELDDLQ